MFQFLFTHSILWIMIKIMLCHKYRKMHWKLKMSHWKSFKASGDAEIVSFHFWFELHNLWVICNCQPKLATIKSADEIHWKRKTSIPVEALESERSILVCHCVHASECMCVYNIYNWIFTWMFVNWAWVCSFVLLLRMQQRNK